MSYTSRVPDQLFKDAHYLGRPADAEDLIVRRRIELINQFEHFVNPQLTMIEVGCGNGTTLTTLAPNFQQALGVDIEDQNIQDTQKSILEAGLKNCKVEYLDLGTTTLNKTYDRLICFEVIEHLKDESQVKALYQLLKPGGLAAISVPNKWWIFETHGAKLPLLPWNRVPFFSWLPRAIHERYAHARIYTKGRVKKLLESHGFEVMSMEYIMAPMDVLPQGKLKSYLLKYIFNGLTTKVPYKSASIFVSAKRK